MKGFLTVVALITTATFGLYSGAFAQTSTPRALPASLDNFYPPNAQGPVYLMAMHEMSSPLSGIVTDMLQGDVANAEANFKKFKDEYFKVAKMVPEWQTSFPIGPVSALETAISEGDPGKVMGALESLGKNCNGCHKTYMPQAQHKYHWGDFSAISATNPATKESMSFQMLMQMIESNMSGMMNDLGQGQLEAARTFADGFAAHFQALKETCEGCHSTERRYFVDDEVMGMVSRLQATMNQAAPDPKTVGELIQGIGMESCHKCHLVHIPAAYSKN